MNEIKFLLSASQKHGTECPELRFILLMFHGIHPIEDSKADKLLRSSIYKRSIVASLSWKNPDHGLGVSHRDQYRITEGARKSTRCFVGLHRTAVARRKVNIAVVNPTSRRSIRRSIRQSVESVVERELT